MISFENIEKRSRLYAFLFNYMKFFHNYIFYEEIDVIGEENIPPQGEPCFTISNHQNGLMDPLAKLNMFPDKRQPVFIARGDIFKKDFVARLLKFTKVLPTYRTRDGDRNDIKKNNDTFHLAGHILSQGGTVILYPEAQHQHGRYLGPFKKGFPRICFSAVEQSDFKKNVKVLPVCIHYSHYERIKSKLLVVIGKPFTFEEFYDIYKTDPNLAYSKLNEKARSILKEMVIDIEDQEHYKEYDFLRTMIPKNRLSNEQSFQAVFQDEKKTIAEIDQIKMEDHAKFELLMQKTRAYSLALQSNRFRDWLIHSNITWARTLFKDLKILLCLPLFLFSLITNGIPFFVPELLVKKLKDRQLFSSVRFGLAFFLFPVWYLIVYLSVWLFSGSLLLGLWIILFAILTIGLLYYYKVWVIKVFHSYRYLIMGKDQEVIRLKEIKKQILQFFNI